MKSKFLFFAIAISLLMSNIQAQEKYYFSKQLDVSYTVAVEQLKEALKDHHFGVVSEIPISETITSNVPGAEMDPYIIIGACNAKVAHKLLQQEPNMGLLLPCKIVVKHIAENRSEVVISNPEVAMAVMGNDAILPILQDVSGQLKKVLKSL